MFGSGSGKIASRRATSSSSRTAPTPTRTATAAVMRIEGSGTAAQVGHVRLTHEVGRAHVGQRQRRRRGDLAGGRRLRPRRGLRGLRRRQRRLTARQLERDRPLRRRQALAHRRQPRPPRRATSAPNPGNTNGQVGIYVQSGKSGGSIVVENNLVHHIGRFFVGENGCGNTTVSLDHGMYLNGVSRRRRRRRATSRSATTSSTTPTTAGASRCTPAASATCTSSTTRSPSATRARATRASSSTPRSRARRSATTSSTTRRAARRSRPPGFSGSITVGNNLTSGNAMHDQGSTPSGMTLSGNLLSTEPAARQPARSNFRLQSTLAGDQRGRDDRHGHDRPRRHQPPAGRRLRHRRVRVPAG